MGLNIKATRRVSLNGFAIGWEDCYLIVNALKDEEARAVAQRVDEAESADNEAALNAALNEFALANIVGGAIINTNDEGQQERIEFSREDVPAVVAALGIAWIIEALSVATGADRLKSKTN